MCDHRVFIRQNIQANIGTGITKNHTPMPAQAPARHKNSAL
ncbi:hypothetical protein CEV31_0952 [Brucella thiophenivorans]|uniref:Uncharacterized protein n=1 Tax=Brucella thiophenivorans TaxID=571255 RepID=A0A256G0S6_9HYPH|nr:hypothetical protein CEV31_0952 [Brucella thiophenivorans]